MQVVHRHCSDIVRLQHTCVKGHTALPGHWFITRAVMPVPTPSRAVSMLLVACTLVLLVTATESKLNQTLIAWQIASCCHMP